MLTLHHLRHSRSLRILWLLEELKAVYGTPYALVIHERTRAGLAPDSLRAVHPMGKSPILIDADQTLMESGFIIEYLLKFYDSKGYFGAPDGRWHDHQFWLHFSESSMMPPLVMKLILDKGADKAPFFARPILKAFKNRLNQLWIAPTIETTAKLLNDALKDDHYVAGEFSGADVQVYFAAKAMSARQDLTSYPNIQNYLARLEARPAFISAVRLGGAALAD